MNGLRADDAESIYNRRVSVASGFSEAPLESEGSGDQLFFKEHNRNTSKGSNRTGMLSRKGTLTGGPTKNRPETKVRVVLQSIQFPYRVLMRASFLLRFSIAPRRTFHVLSNSSRRTRTLVLSTSNLRKTALDTHTLHLCSQTPMHTGQWKNGMLTWEASRVPPHQHKASRTKYASFLSRSLLLAALLLGS